MFQIIIIFYQRVHIAERNASINILGISSPKVCYRGALSHDAVENFRILAWSSSHLFEIVHQGNLQVRKIHLDYLLNNYPGISFSTLCKHIVVLCIWISIPPEYTLSGVLFSPNPSYISLLLQSSQIHVFLECSLQTTEIRQCIVKAMPGNIRDEKSIKFTLLQTLLLQIRALILLFVDIQVEVLNTAHTSLLIKTQHSVTQFTKRGNFVFTSRDKIDHVYVNSGWARHIVSTVM